MTITYLSLYIIFVTFDFRFLNIKRIYILLFYCQHVCISLDDDRMCSQIKFAFIYITQITESEKPHTSITNFSILSLQHKYTNILS